MLRALRKGRDKNAGNAKRAKNAEDVKNTVLSSSLSGEFSFLLVSSLTRYSLITQFTVLVPLAIFSAMQLYSGIDNWT
jgi:hypothetical protein